MSYAFSDMKAPNEYYEELPLPEVSNSGEAKSSSLNAQSPKGIKEKSDVRAETKAALEAGILPCTKLATLGIPPREAILGEWFFEGTLASSTPHVA
jgi:hypothetical protein